MEKVKIITLVILTVLLFGCQFDGYDKSSCIKQCQNLGCKYVSNTTTTCTCEVRGHFITATDGSDEVRWVNELKEVNDGES